MSLVATILVFNRFEIHRFIKIKSLTSTIELVVLVWTVNPNLKFILLKCSMFSFFSYRNTFLGEFSNLTMQLFTHFLL